jgi:hypothetical protein
MLYWIHCGPNTILLFLTVPSLVPVLCCYSSLPLIGPSYYPVVHHCLLNFIGPYHSVVRHCLYIGPYYQLLFITVSLLVHTFLFSVTSSLLVQVLYIQSPCSLLSLYWSECFYPVVRQSNILSVLGPGTILQYVVYPFPVFRSVSINVLLFILFLLMFDTISNTAVFFSVSWFVPNKFLD